ncbi:hypothetical protein VTK26DRAFT_664 [Humicola hyalothermophila]
MTAGKLEDIPWLIHPVCQCCRSLDITYRSMTPEVRTHGSDIFHLRFLPGFLCLITANPGTAYETPLVLGSHGTRPIAPQIIQQLLEHGYRVRTTAGPFAKASWLDKLFAQYVKAGRFAHVTVLSVRITKTTGGRLSRECMPSLTYRISHPSVRTSRRSRATRQPVPAHS